MSAGVDVIIALLAAVVVLTVCAATLALLLWREVSRWSSAHDLEDKLTRDNTRSRSKVTGNNRRKA